MYLIIRRDSKAWSNVALLTWFCLLSASTSFLLQQPSSLLLERLTSTCAVASKTTPGLPATWLLKATPSKTRDLSPTTTSSSSSNKNNKRRQDDFARGAALLIENVAVQRGAAQILKNIDWRVEPQTKWALIGGNGCGKSTLLKAIAGELLYEGDIHLGASEEKVGYLRQTAVSGSTKTVFDEAASGMMEIQKAKEALETAQEKLATVTEEDEPAESDVLLRELDRATARYEALGGYTSEQKVATVLKGLGFNDLTMRCNELSGGWQMRVAFAKLLLSEPKICLSKYYVLYCIACCVEFINCQKFLGQNSMRAKLIYFSFWLSKFGIVS